MGKKNGGVTDLNSSLLTNPTFIVHRKPDSFTTRGVEAVKLSTLLITDGCNPALVPQTSTLPGF